MRIECRFWRLAALALVWGSWVRPAAAGEPRPDPATTPANRAQGAVLPDTIGMSAHPISRRVWELPAVEVMGRRRSPLREEDRIGSYAQPRWTAHRRFTTTRVYVVPEGFFEFEYWLIPEFARHGEVGVTIQHEVELGLPGRLQLDLYSVTHKQGKQGRLSQDEEKVELRWALARWGALPLNPTLYLEWIGIDRAPDHLEGKLLLGGEAAPGWHWGVNLVLEHEMGAEQENSNEVTAGLSRTVADHRLSFGAESKFAFVDVSASRGHYAREIQLGPSVQFQPLHRMHVDLVPLFSATEDSPRTQITCIMGWEF